jgi:hypothetical protein
MCLFVYIYLYEIELDDFFILVYEIDSFFSLI